MALLTELGTGQGYLKAGFLGFQAGGKTFTALLLALGVRNHFKLKGPIAMFDTEGGSEYIAEKVQKETGQRLLGVRRRSFQDLLSVAQECVDRNVSVFLVDSITHPWRELCDAYLIQVNERRKTKNLPARTKLEFQDWNPIKSEWGKWTAFYLNSPLHIIICGRAGFEYEMDRNEETGQKELQKTGIRMKTESEFGFEPALLVEMERDQIPDGKGGFKLSHHAKVIKDRFDVLDGKEMDNPTFEFFKPHVERLTAGALAPVDTAIKTALTVDEAGQDDFERLRRRRDIAIEQIQNDLSIILPGSTGKDRQAKYAILNELFGTTSETALHGRPPDELLRASDTIAAFGQAVLNGYTWETLIELKKEVRRLHESLEPRREDSGTTPEVARNAGAGTENVTLSAGGTSEPAAPSHAEADLATLFKDFCKEIEHAKTEAECHEIDRRALEQPFHVQAMQTLNKLIGARMKALKRG